MKIKEFEIPVPWGHVAVKAWGEESNVPVLCIHGIADNAGSFDGLIPLLPQSFYYICIDLPSHGRSSSYPPYLFITSMNNAMAIKLVVNYINRKKYIFMCHSWGGQTCLLLSQLYPEYFLKLIIIDSFYYYPLLVQFFKGTLRSKIDGLIKTHQFAVKKSVIHYTYDKALNKLMSSRLDNELTKEAAKRIANRALIKHGNKYTFSTDSRLAYYVDFFANVESLSQLLLKFPTHCPLLLLYSTDWQYSIFQDILHKFPNYTIIKIPSDHDVYITQPKVIALEVIKFLLNYSAKL